MIKKYTLVVACALLAATACNKDKDMVNATVVDTGDITNEGCGYLLRLEDSALVQPNYLPSAYQHAGIKVKVKYTHTGVIDTCDYTPKIFDLVSIQDIKNDRD
ncbi:MAG: hypothetical protein QM642_05250 [Edaphocola sp.]